MDDGSTTPWTDDPEEIQDFYHKAMHPEFEED